MKRVSEITVRHPYVGEVPEELLVGFEAFKINPEWQWVLEIGGKVEAQMLCANAHGMLIIMRLTAFEGLPPGWLVKFLRGVLRDAKASGVLGYVTFLSDQNPAELKLMRIVQRSGGMLMPQSGAWAFGKVETRY